MWAEEDRRRLLESRHDLSACEKAAELTTDASLQGAVVASHGELALAQKTLRDAAAKSARERSETDQERTALEQAKGTLVRRYGFIRGKVQDALLNVDPDAGVLASEMERRSRLFGRVFVAAPSELERLGPNAVIERIGSVVDALRDEGDLKPFGHEASLRAALSVAQQAAKELNRETDEDAQAMAALRKAREAFDRALSAHALQVESILVRQGRESELGRFVLAKDAAYAARRAARMPVSEEPGAGDLETSAAKG